ncbi:hypothetical protein M3202_13950 [Alkalihalobacillus oceani]|uniref:DNA-binding protein n=1 Tax=Halalkalibacter oceani TaxID=1653776 RepID=A0A9X2DRM0_9BACI|nr:hypothetical protein [Halalkalibacter oceani]MCM3715188.1 hypothetical protein [Halalkalibacter oceani]
MYYNKKRLEELRKEGEEKFEEMERERKRRAIGQKYKANEIEIRCVHCKHDKFELDETLLNTRAMTFFDVEWLNDTAKTLICKECGYIHWFAKEVVEVNE